MSKWSSYNDVQRNDIATQIAGTRQRQQFMVLMQNQNEVLKEQTVQTDSAGNAMKRYQTYAESTEAKANDLKNSMQKMWSSFINSSTINSAIGFLNNLVKGIIAVGNASTSSKVALAGLTTAFIALTVAIKATSLSQVNDFLASLVTKEGIATLATEGLTGAVNLLKGAFSLLFSPLGALVAVLGIAGVAIAKHIQNEAQEKQKTDELKQSYQSLTQAIKENNVTKNNSDYQKLKKEQDELTSAIKAQTKAQNELNESKVLGTDPYVKGDRNSQTYQYAMNQRMGELNDTLATSSKKIKEVEGSLNSAGVAFDKTTGKIKSVTEAEQEMARNDKINNIKETSEAELKNKDAIVQEYNEYKRLSEAENQDAQTKLRMSQIAEDLKGKVVGLSVSFDKNGNAVINSTKNVDKQISMLGTEGIAIDTLTNKNLEDAKNQEVIDDGLTKTKYVNAKSRINSILSEIQALQAAEDATKDYNNSVNNSLDKNLFPGLSGVTKSANKAADDQINAKKAQVDKIQQIMKQLDADYNNAGAGSGSDNPNPSDNGGYMPSGDDSEKTKKKKSEDEAQRKALEAKKQSLEQEKQNVLNNLTNEENAEKQQQDNITKALQSQLDELKAKKDLQDQINEKLNYENDIIKDRQALENAENENTVRIYENGRFVWATDQAKIDTAKDSLSKELQDYKKWQDDVKEQSQENALQKQIQASEDKKSQIETNFENQRNAIEQNYENKSNSIENQISSIGGYASGTDNATQGVKQVAENSIEIVVGRQLRDFKGGETVLNGSTTGKILNSSNNQPTSSASESKANTDTSKEVKDGLKNIGDTVNDNKLLVHKPITDLKDQIHNEIEQYVNKTGQYSIIGNKNIGDGVNQSKEFVINPTQTLINSIKDMLNKFVASTQQTGTDMTTDFGKGITNGEDNLKKTISDLCQKIVDEFKKDLGVHSPSTIAEQIGIYFMQGFVNGLNKADIESVIASKMTGMVGAMKVNLPGSIDDWLKQAGVPEAWFPAMKVLISKESSGDPNEVNNVAVGGEYATGLMQTLPSTFREFMASGHSNILNPIDNIMAAVNYIRKTYGTPYAIKNLFSGNYVGYQTGTENARSGVAEVNENGFEIMLGNQFRALQGGETILNHGDSVNLVKQLINQSNATPSYSTIPSVINNSKNVAWNLGGVSFSNTQRPQQFIDQMQQLVKTHDI